MSRSKSRQKREGSNSVSRGAFIDLQAQQSNYRIKPAETIN